MPIEHKLTNNHGITQIFHGIGEAGNAKADHRVATISASAQPGSTYTFARVPSNARFCDLSRFFSFGSSSGSLSYKCGIFGVDGNITDDDDAIIASIAANVASPLAIIRTANATADRGKPFWEFVNGVTKDPGGFFDIKITLLGSGTMVQELVLSVCIFYTID